MVLGCLVVVAWRCRRSWWCKSYGELCEKVVEVGRVNARVMAIVLADIITIIIIIISLASEEDVLRLCCEYDLLSGASLMVK